MKKLGAILICVSLIFGAFAGCSKAEPEAESSSPAAVEPSADSTETNDIESSEAPVDTTETVTINIAGMNGPTGIGMANLIRSNELGETSNKYNITLEGAADAVMGKVINGELDIAAVPVNAASVLYNKTQKEITFLGVNTLGVLHLLTNGVEVNSAEDLRGKTIYSTGQGTTPEYTFRYILEQNGINPDEDLTIIYETEAAALQTKLATGDIEIAVLPEPMVSAVTTKNPDIKISMDLTEEWSKATAGKPLTTGGVIVRNEFLEAHPEAVAKFLEEYEVSCKKATEDLEGTAKLTVEYGILAAEEIAVKAIPRCNIEFIGGEEMKQAVSSYLEVLYNANPDSVGGSLPDEEFYYKG